MFSHNRDDFGPDFLFGVAMAAHQIEGGQTDGRGSSIWDTFAATPGNTKNADTGKIACDHYHRWPEDLDLIRDAGFNAYRFSFAWSRLVPEGTGALNRAGFDFYDRLIDGMLERGIKPLATLYHWDLPSALQDRGGWMNRDTAHAFADYAAEAARHFGDRLDSIATFNEPWCVTVLSHYMGIHAPGYRDVRATARAMHHVLLAHGLGITAMRDAGVKAKLGIVVNMEKTEPFSQSADDVEAAALGDDIFNRFFLDGVVKGTYPERVVKILEPYLPAKWQDDMTTLSPPIDWIGINYYTRSLYKHDDSVPVFPFTQSRGDLEKSNIGWEIYPQALTEFLVRASKDYPGLPIYVTENGISETDEAKRIDFFDKHFAAIIEAQRQGADIRGYIAWTLIDNFEWAEGYGPKFGIVAMDLETRDRNPKDSYHAFRQMLTKGR
ncbi:putative beta-glucosidase [Agrobacterium rubi TR3 = NBRC 13261]|uniref:Beta-glucosidase n=1 Tax=Agrobacterium rubi TR3 = NBRC 13261 TaxID=1368415 RepID=A0A081CSM4_9HYPH|nr:GH1 family beta-glucosidase [Agrobacterium rubi]MBP1878814.1 beta-glucosidase [Agrobacterium rubi]GAK69670.1 putative beta-glucosidase [Agrobacterium rubi TR3 = NBRC 13261]